MAKYTDGAEIAVGDRVRIRLSVPSQKESERMQYDSHGKPIPRPRPPRPKGHPVPPWKLPPTASWEDQTWEAVVGEVNGAAARVRYTVQFMGKPMEIYRWSDPIHLEKIEGAS